MCQEAMGASGVGTDWGSALTGSDNEGWCLFFLCVLCCGSMQSVAQTMRSESMGGILVTHYKDLGPEYEALEWAPRQDLF